MYTKNNRKALNNKIFDFRLLSVYYPNNYESYLQKKASKGGFH